MTTAIATQTPSGLSQRAVENLLLDGDLKAMSDGQRAEYYRLFCKAHGLDPLTKPFEFLRLNGRLVLYPTRVAAEQLRMNHGVSLEVVGRETGFRTEAGPEGRPVEVPDVYTVRVRAVARGGRADESEGVVSVYGLTGESLAVARMKCETKAKRRVTLSICGIGLPDETEVDSIRGAEKVPFGEANPSGVLDAEATLRPMTRAEKLAVVRSAASRALVSQAKVLERYGAASLDDLGDADLDSVLRTAQARLKGAGPN